MQQRFGKISDISEKDRWICENKLKQSLSFTININCFTSRIQYPVQPIDQETDRILRYEDPEKDELWF